MSTKTLTNEESNLLVMRMLKMIKEQDQMFLCVSDDIISDLVGQDYILIDPENETMYGTSLTKKGWKELYEYDIL